MGEKFSKNEYTFSSPQHLGEIPERVDQEISPSKSPVGRDFRVCDGPEVYKLAPDGSVIEVPLTSVDDIQEGCELAVPGLAVGYHVMVVERTNARWQARSSHLFASLCWDADDRHCWTMGGLFNTRFLKNLNIPR